MRIYPSLLSADLVQVGSLIHQLEPYCDGFHIDIMDNRFVPNHSMGPEFAHQVALKTAKQLWVHAMVENPGSMIEQLELPAQSILSFHIESTHKILETIARIREKNWLASLAISPKTSLKTMEPFLKSIDQAVIMSVEPGFSGQQFLPASLDRLKQLLQLRAQQRLSFSIAMDGGINNHNLAQLSHEGADEVAIGSAIFNAQNPVRALQELAEIK